MKTVRDACVLQENALEIRISDQIEQLDELIAEEGEGSTYFEKTHITEGMRTLLSEGIARLAGKSSQAVFHLKQAMGGGKTHLLVGFGLVARHASLRKTYCRDIPYINMLDTVNVTAFNGRNNPVHYFWGEIAEQLDRESVFRDFWVNGPKAPDENDWIRLFESENPILILLDEMSPYFDYYTTQQIGEGTVAKIVTRAFANMLSAAVKKKNVCIIVSDLDNSSYIEGGRLINQALNDARQELGRQERTITPVDLAGNEIYDILRKRLFKSLPDRAVIEDTAEKFSQVLQEATKAKVVNRGAEAIADEIINTYPFHPRLKNLIALFKENEQFKQTRGLMELVSRLLKSVWNKAENDVYLIGPQHFDLSISEVREKISEISGMRDVIAKDLWDSNQSAHAQIVDLNSGNDAAKQAGVLLLTASLSTAVNAVKGLSDAEMLECLVSPLRGASEYTKAFEELVGTAWYLHHTPEGKHYFDRQENLTKLLQSLAEDAPDPKVDELICHRMVEMYKPVRKTAYEEVLPLPRLDEVAERVRRGRVLLIISPDSKIPPVEVQRFFESLIQKNNICVLTGDKTQFGSLEKAARYVFAGQKAELRLPKGHPQREDLEKKQEQFEQDFTSTVLNIFDKLLFPIQRPDRPAQLVAKALDQTRDSSKPYNGEEQVEKTLVSDPMKLYLDIEQEFDAIRDKAEDLLWSQGQDEGRWFDLIDRMAERAGMPWLPPRGLEQLKTLACARGKWEDLGNGYVTKKPKKKKTSVQIVEETQPDDEGVVRLRIMPQHAGPAPRIYYAEDGEVSNTSTQLTDQILESNALRIMFMVVDPSNQYETGDPTIWTNKLVIRNKLKEVGESRELELFVVPEGDLKYTLDGSEPRNGIPYSGKILLGKNDIVVRVFAEFDGIEAKAEFKFQATGEQRVVIDNVKSAKLISSRPKSLDSQSKTFDGLTEAREKGITFERVRLNIGQGNQGIQLNIGDLQVSAEYIDRILKVILMDNIFDSNTQVSMSFNRANFHSGHDLKQFADKLGIELNSDEVEQ